MCKDWRGKFVFGRGRRTETYRSGPVVSGIMWSTDIDAGSSRFDGWEGLRQVDDSFVIIETSQPFYRFRSDIQNRVELNRSFKDGVLSSPLKYDLSGVEVVSASVLPMEEQRRSVKGLTIDAKGNDVSAEFVRVETSLLDLDVRFLQDPGHSLSQNVEYIRFYECCAVRARVEMQWGNFSEAGWTYNLRMDRCYDIQIEATADGDGWGATGSNTCQRVTFSNSNLSRIDFHHPIAEWLRVRNSTVGSWGVLVTALGDVDLDTVQFVQRGNRLANFAGVVSSREDVGGFCDGDLIMRNVTVVGGDDALNLIRHHQAGSYDNSKPDGSPIAYRFWRRILVDGLRVNGVRHRDAPFIAPTDIRLGTASIEAAETISLTNVDADHVQMHVQIDEAQRADRSTAVYLDRAKFSQVRIANFSDGMLVASLKDLVPNGQNSAGLLFEGKSIATIWGGVVADFSISKHDSAAPLVHFERTAFTANEPFAGNNSNGVWVTMNYCLFTAQGLAAAGRQHGINLIEASVF